MPSFFERGGWVDNAAHDVGNFFTHDIPNFFEHDIPQAVHNVSVDLGKLTSTVILDTTNVLGQGIKNVVQPIFESPKPLIQQVTTSLNTLIPTVSGGGKTLLEGFSGVTGSLSMPFTVALIVGGVLIVFFMQK